MKKLICILLSALMLLSVATLVACTKTEEPLKMGLGLCTEVSATNAGEKDGTGIATVTAALITVDANGKIVACQIDTMDNQVSYTAEGKAVANSSFKTKYELGADYNMVLYGEAKAEWFEQVDAFETVVVGKSLNEVKALVAEGDTGTSDVVAAGCTIKVKDFVLAVEKAFANLVDSNATASSTLKLGMNTEQITADATEEKDGSNQVETTVFAAALDAEGKVVAAASDCVQVTFTFDIAGASTFDATATVSTKRELGADYNMVLYGEAKAEWFEQADAFNALCIGKTVSEIKALCASDNYGTDAVKTAGCTIKVNGFTKAAAKLG